MADVSISTLIDEAKKLVLNEVKLLSGVEEEVVALSNKLDTTRQYLDDAERKGVEDESIKSWLKSLEDACYEMEYVFDEWDYILFKQKMEQSDGVVVPKHKVCSFIPSSLPCLCFKKVSSRHLIAKKIQKVKVQLDQILREKDQFAFVKGQTTDLALRIPMGQALDPYRGSLRVQSTSYVEVEEIRGRDHDRDNLIKLLSNGASQGIEIIYIVGLGGLGKITLAQLVYNDNRLKFDLKIWVCVSDHRFDLVEIVKKILKNFHKAESRDDDDLQSCLRVLENSILGKKFLLVLDDVWTEGSTQWEPLISCLKSGNEGSKVLVTTRKEKVEITMETRENRVHPGLLSDDDCWSLLSRISLPDKTGIARLPFEETGKKIASKCKGLPLVAKMMGSLLRFKPGLDGWDRVLESEVWELGEDENEIFPNLHLSYNELPPILKRCFSYCGVFPKSYRMNVEVLVSHWLALGYLGFDGSTGELEQRGREYFDELAMRSFFQDLGDEYKNHIVNYCRMHDIVHDFAQYLRKDARTEQSTCQICSCSLVSCVKQYHSLFFHNEDVPSICDCLTKVRVMCLSQCVFQSIQNGLTNLIHLRHLDLSYTNNLTTNDLKIVCKLYNLKALLLKRCKLRKIPEEIGKLIRLRYLDLQENYKLEIFPKCIGNLCELRSLNISKCTRLCELPEEFGNLTKLKHLYSHGKFSERGHQFLDQAISGLKDLCTLKEFAGKLSCLKELNKLSGSLRLIITKISGDYENAVAEARGAELEKKKLLDRLYIEFSEVDACEMCEGVLGALQPHSNLSYLDILWYMGSKLPDWITSPLNQLKHIVLYDHGNITLLPPLGKLQLLEVLQVYSVRKLVCVGRDLLGITEDMTGASSSLGAIGFPKLKELIFRGCEMWREWEDIIAEEEEASTALSLFPCLKTLEISFCRSINVLPHRLLRKASSLEMLDVSGSPQLGRQYGERRDGSSWKFISHIHRVEFSAD